ncbi:hypothetical protein [Streptomonospora sp. PA3]|uniref:hypothetical protein n=1 Tax=Streptomonospora sp. PA3 TaxID=2607326 RepID=UPI0016423CA0|nr:hypothetical protein [Streptomonospora sp. PA3]
MSHDDGRDWRAPGSRSGSGQPGEAASGPAAGGWWDDPGAGVPAAGNGWAAPGGSGQAPGTPPPPVYGHGGGYAPGGPYGDAPGGPAPAGPPPGVGRPWAPRPGVIALRPLTLGDVFNGAFGYIRQNPKATLGLALVVSALFSIVSSIGMGGYLSDYGTVMRETLNNPTGPVANDPMPFEAWSVITVYAGALLTYIGQILLTGLLAAVVGLAVLGRRLSMREALQAVRGRLGAVFGVAVLLFLLSLLWTVLLVGVVVGAVLLGVAVHPAAGIPAGLLGVLGLIALAVWVYVRTSLAMPVAVLERSGPAAALGRSWRLTQRSWWRVFGILLVAQILVSMVVNLLSTPFTGGAMVLSFLAPDAAWMPVAATAASFVGTVLAGTLGIPFIVGVTTLLYIDLRMRREGLDLRLQAAAQSGQHVDAGIYLPEETAPAGPPSGPQPPTAPGAGADPGGYGPGGGHPPPGPGQGGYPRGGYGQGGTGALS